MSEENVETVRRAWQAYMRRDNEAALAFYHPEAELRHPLDGSLYQGLDGVRAFFSDWHAAWSELLANDVEELIDAGNEVIAVMRIRARGRSSGVVVERREWDVWTLRDGKLWRLRIYATEADALEAAGLSG